MLFAIYSFELSNLRSIDAQSGEKFGKNMSREKKYLGSRSVGDSLLLSLEEVERNILWRLVDLLVYRPTFQSLSLSRRHETSHVRPSCDSVRARPQARQIGRIRPVCSSA